MRMKNEADASFERVRFVAKRGLSVPIDSTRKRLRTQFDHVYGSTGAETSRTGSSSTL